jgi:hypothetical protein
VPGGELPGERREHRVVPPLVVIDQILMAKDRTRGAQPPLQTLCSTLPALGDP